MLAADFIVDTLADESYDDEWTSLREALALAAGDGHGDLDRIAFDESLRGGTIQLTQGQLNITTDVQIVGLGMGELSISGDDASRVFAVSGSGSGSTISDITLRDGNAYEGGAIYVVGDLSLARVEITDNYSSGGGGGIYAKNGDLVVEQSYIHGNQSAWHGAGIFRWVFGGESTIVSASTIADNAVTTWSSGGAIAYYDYGTQHSQTEIRNSTIRGNAAAYGGAIANFGSPRVEILNSTITENQAYDTSGGLINLNYTATYILRNSIVSGNWGGWIVTRDVWGPLHASSSNNLFNFVDPVNSGLFGANSTNRQYHSPAQIGLGPYDDSSDFVPHYPLVVGGLAIDAGDTSLAAALTGDQREFAGRAIVDRIHGASVDVGSYEYGSVPVLVDPAFAISEAHAEGMVNASWTASNGHGRTVALWRGEGPEGVGLYLQSLNTIAGLAGTPRLVNLGVSVGLIDQFQAALDEAGNLAVAWIQGGMVLLRRFSASGVAIDELPIAVNASEPPIAGLGSSKVTIASNDGGNLVLAWVNPSGDISFRRYTMSGLSLDGGVRVAASATNAPIDVASSQRWVAVAADGGFYLLHADVGGINGGPSVLRHFAASGGLLSSRTLDSQLSSTGEPPMGAHEAAEYAGTLHRPLDIAINPVGGVTVLWNEEAFWNTAIPGVASQVAIAETIYVASIDGADAALAPVVVTGGQAVFTIAPSFEARLFYVDAPSLAVDRDGRVGVAYERQIQDSSLPSPQNFPSRRLGLAWLDASGAPIVEPRELPSITTDSPMRPQLVAIDGSNQLLAYVRDGNIVAQRYRLPSLLSLDSGKLRIDVSAFSGTVAVGARLVGNVALVTINGELTDYVAADVIALEIIGSDLDDRIDLSAVTSTHFANLEAGDIEVTAGAGDDVLFASPRGGTYRGDAGDDRLNGNVGSDSLDGGTGNDILSGRAGDDALSGGAGNDTLRGGAGSDVLSGGDGDDVLYGDADVDQLAGGAGNDMLDAGSGANQQNQQLDGGTGDDRYWLTDSDDTGGLIIVDSAGTDTIDLSRASVAAALDLNASTLAWNNASRALVNAGVIENLIGTAHGDILAGNALANVIDGGAGGDVINGGGRGDRFIGGAGNDTLTMRAGIGAGAGGLQFDGGAGSDRFLLAPADATFAVDISASPGDDTLDVLALTTSQATISELGQNSSQQIGHVRVVGASGSWETVEADVDTATTLPTISLSNLSDGELWTINPSSDSRHFAASLSVGSSSTLIVDVLEKPDWVSVSGSAGSWTFEATNAPNESEDYRIRVRVRDSVTGAARDVTLFARVGAGNSEPVLLPGPVPNVTVFDEEELVLYTLYYAEPVTAYLSPDAPSGARIVRISDICWQLQWQTDESHGATNPYKVTVLATDHSQRPLRIATDFAITVNETTSAPELSNLVAIDGGDIRISGTVDSVEGAETVDVVVSYDVGERTFTVIVPVVVSADDSSTGTFVVTNEDLRWLPSDVLTYVNVGLRYFSLDPDSTVNDEPAGYATTETQAISITPISVHPELSFDGESLYLPTSSGEDPEVAYGRPTIAGTIGQAIAGVVVRFYADAADGGFELGSTITNADGSFEFTPELIPYSYDEDTNERTVHVVVDHRTAFGRAAIEQTVSPSELTGSISFTLRENSVDVRNVDVELQAPYRYQPATRAVVSGIVNRDHPGTFDEVVVEYTYTLSGETFTQTTSTIPMVVAGVVSELQANYSFEVPAAYTDLAVRTIEWDDYANLLRVSGSVTPGFSSSNPHTIDPTIRVWPKLSGETNDPVQDATLAGLVDGIDNDAAEYLVEIATSNDFEADIIGTTTVAADGTFEFSPRNIIAGVESTLYARLVRRFIGANYQAGQWESSESEVADTTFTLASTAAVTVTDLRLAWDTGADDDSVTVLPTIAGTVEYRGDMRAVVIEIDTDGDGRGDARVTPNETGNFRYTIPTLETGLVDGPGGSVTRLAVRALVPQIGRPTVIGELDAWQVPDLGFDEAELAEWQIGIEDLLSRPVGGLHASPWEVSAFEIDLEQLHGIEATVYIETTLGRALTGTVEGVGLATLGGIEIEVWIEGHLDGITALDSAGGFAYRPRRASSIASTSDVELRLRTGMVDNIGEPLAIDLINTVAEVDPEATSSQVDLQLAWRLPSDSTAPRQPTLAGQISSLATGESLAGRTIEFDFDDDGFADAATVTDGNGAFQITASLAITTNPAPVHARVLMPGNAGSLSGGWNDAPLPTTIPTSIAPRIAEFRLYNDTGAMQSTSVDILDRVTWDAELTGRVTDASGHGLSYRSVEIDLDGDGVANDYSMTDVQGRFRYKPADLATGYHSIRVRVLEADGWRGTTATTGWAPITNTGVPTYTSDSLNLNQGSVGFVLIAVPEYTVVGINTSNNLISGTVVWDTSTAAPAANATVRFYWENAGGDVLLGQTTSGRDGKFAFVPAGISINGSATASVRVELHQPEFEGTPTPIDPVGFAWYSLVDGLTVDAPDLSSVRPDLYTVTLTGTVSPPSSGAFAPLYAAITIGSRSFVAPIRSATDPGSPATAVYSYSLDIDLRDEWASEILQPSTVTVVRAVGTTNAGLAVGIAVTGTLDIGPDQLPSIALGEEVELSGERTAEPKITGTIVGSATTTTTTTPQVPTIQDPENTNQTLQPAVAYTVEVDLDGDGFADGSVELASGTYDFELPLGDLLVGEHHLRLRVVADITYFREIANQPNQFVRAERVETEWVEDTLEYLGTIPEFTVATPVATNPTLHIAIDVAPEGNPANLAAHQLTVEIDEDRDGVVDGTAVLVTTQGSPYFEYTLRNASVIRQARNVGADIGVRVSDNFSRELPLVGGWESKNVRLANPAPPTIESIGLEIDEDPSLTGFASSRPVIVGSVTVPDGSVLTRVDFLSATGDIAIASTTVDVHDQFRYEPSNLIPGVNSIRIRVVTRWGSESLTSVPGVFEYTYFSGALPVLHNFIVVDDEQGIVTGRVTVDGFGTEATVNFAVHQGTAQLPGERRVETDANGFFRYQLPELVGGYLEVSPTVTTLTGSVTGNSVLFEHAPDEVDLPDYHSWGLLADTGSNTSNSITADPTLVGYVRNWVPQSYAGVQYAWTDSSGAQSRTVRVPIPASGIFEVSADGLPTGTAITATLTIQAWNPSAVGAGWLSQTIGATRTFQINAAELTAPTVTSLRMASTPSVAVPQISSSPTFAGAVTMQGNYASAVVYFDHDGDGIDDGSTTLKPDKTFYYHASGLQPSTSAQSMTARVVYRTYTGQVVSSAPVSLVYTLTAAPIVSRVDEAVFEGDPLTGEFFYPATGSPVVIVEYVVFSGEGVPIPEDLATYALAANRQIATRNGNQFTIPASVLQPGLTTILVRAIDVTNVPNPTYGAGTYSADAIDFAQHAIVGTWRVQRIYVSPDADATTIAMNTQSVAGVVQSGSPIVSGQIGTNLASYGAIVEVTYQDVESAELSRTFRTTASGSGSYQLAPIGLTPGRTYRASTRVIAYDPVTQAELVVGESNAIEFLLLAASGTTIVIEELTSSSVTGFVAAANNSRIAGLRVDLEWTGDDQVDGHTYTNANGQYDFSLPPLTIGTYIVRVGVQQWAADNYRDPDFVEGSAYESELAGKKLTISAEPPAVELDPVINDDRSAYDLAEATFRDALAFVLEGTAVNAGDGRLNAGMGTVALLHYGGSRQDPLVDSAEHPFDLTLNPTTDVDLDDSDTFQGQSNGASLTLTGGTFSWNLTVAQTGSSYTETSVDATATLLDVDIRFATTEIIDGVFVGTVIEIFDANYSTRVEGRLPHAANLRGEVALDEYLAFRFVVTRTYGDRTEVMAGESGYTFSTPDLTSNPFGPNGTPSQIPFSVTETLVIETWVDETSTTSTSSTTQSQTTTTTTQEHSLYVEQSTVAGGYYGVAGTGYSGTKTVDASGNFDGFWTSETTYSNHFDGDNTESGQYSSEQSLVYNGRLHAVTTYSASIETTNFDLHETSVGSSSAGGSGHASYHSSPEGFNSQRSESWTFGMSANFESEQSLVGTAGSRASSSNALSNEYEYLDAVLTGTSVYGSQASGSTSVSFSEQSSDASTSGNGNSSFSAQAGVRADLHASIHAVDDDFTITATVSMQLTAAGQSNSSGTLHYSSSDAESDSSQTVSASTSVDGSVTSNVIATPQGDRVGSTYSGEATASLRMTTRSDGSDRVPEAPSVWIESSSFTQLTSRVTASADGTTTSDSRPGMSSTDIDRGHASRQATSELITDNRTQLYGQVEGIDGYGTPVPLWMNVASSFAHGLSVVGTRDDEDYDFERTPSGRSDRGQFSSQTELQSRNVSQVVAASGEQGAGSENSSSSYSASSDATNWSSVTIAGSFSEGAGAGGQVLGRSADVSTDSRSNGGTWSQVTLSGSTTDNSLIPNDQGVSDISLATLDITITQSGSSTTKSGGTSTLENDRVVDSAVTSLFGSDGQVTTSVRNSEFRFATRDAEESATLSGGNVTEIFSASSDSYDVAFSQMGGSSTTTETYSPPPPGGEGLGEGGSSQSRSNSRVGLTQGGSSTSSGHASSIVISNLTAAVASASIMSSETTSVSTNSRANSLSRTSGTTQSSSHASQDGEAGFRESSDFISSTQSDGTTSQRTNWDSKLSQPGWLRSNSGHRNQSNSGEQSSEITSTSSNGWSHDDNAYSVWGDSQEQGSFDVTTGWNTTWGTSSNETNALGSYPIIRTGSSSGDVGGELSGSGTIDSTRATVIEIDDEPTSEQSGSYNDERRTAWTQILTNDDVDVGMITHLEIDTASGNAGEERASREVIRHIREEQVEVDGVVYDYRLTDQRQASERIDGRRGDVDNPTLSTLLIADSQTEMIARKVTETEGSTSATRTTDELYDDDYSTATDYTERTGNQATLSASSRDWGTDGSRTIRNYHMEVGDSEFALPAEAESIRADSYRVEDHTKVYLSESRYNGESTFDDENNLIRGTFTASSVYETADVTLSPSNESFIGYDGVDGGQGFHYVAEYGAEAGEGYSYPASTATAEGTSERRETTTSRNETEERGSVGRSGGMLVASGDYITIATTTTTILDTAFRSYSSTTLPDRRETIQSSYEQSSGETQTTTGSYSATESRTSYSKEYFDNTRLRREYTDVNDGVVYNDYLHGRDERVVVSPDERSGYRKTFTIGIDNQAPVDDSSTTRWTPEQEQPTVIVVTGAGVRPAQVLVERDGEGEETPQEFVPGAAAETISRSVGDEDGFVRELDGQQIVPHLLDDLPVKVQMAYRDQSRFLVTAHDNGIYTITDLKDLSIETVVDESIAPIGLRQLRARNDATNAATYNAQLYYGTEVLLSSPVLGELRDLSEALNGRSVNPWLPTDPRLSAQQRNDALRASILPGVSGANVRQAERGLELLKDARFTKPQNLPVNGLVRGSNPSRVVFEGLEVRAVRDLSHIDDSTLRAMSQNGFAAKDISGEPLILHHLGQNAAGPIVEMPAFRHNVHNSVQHPFGNTPGAGLTAEQRATFDIWRENYWRTRALDELQRRGLTP